MASMLAMVWLTGYGWMQFTSCPAAAQVTMDPYTNLFALFSDWGGGRRLCHPVASMQSAACLGEGDRHCWAVLAYQLRPRAQVPHHCFTPPCMQASCQSWWQWACRP
jgi:hypothetical protein